MISFKRLVKTIFAAAFVGAVFGAPAFGESASVGVEVEPTVPPAVVTTTEPPRVTTTTTTSTTTRPRDESPTTTIEPEVVTDPDPVPAPLEIIKEAVKDDVEQTVSGSIVGQVKVVAQTAGKVLSETIQGKPVAEALSAALPASVASVVVPAVRTASTFVFPIGLAVLVVLFMIVQQRLDSSDPKLIAAPIAPEEDYVEFDYITFGDEPATEPERRE